MLHIRKLKVGDVLEIGRPGFIIGPAKENYYMFNCTPGTENELASSSIFTFLGLHHVTMVYFKHYTKSGRKRKIPKRTTRKFYNCLFDNKIILVSECTLKNFNKIYYKKEINEL